MANSNELTRYGNMSQMVDEPPLLPPTQVNNAQTPPMGTKSMSIAALDAAIEYEIRMGTLDPNMDKKQMRRIISNRYAAKKAHDRKINKQVGLENSYKDLESTVATLRPQIEHEEHFQSHLKLENAMLSHQLKVTTDLSNLRAAEISMNQVEKQRLMNEILEMQEPSSLAPLPPNNYDVVPSGLDMFNRKP